MGYGLTNYAIGQAQVNAYDDYGNYWVTSLRSNGLDGVSIVLGEPDSGVFLTPTTDYLEDGNWMVAKTYGRLNGADDTLLATIQGGRASDRIYPMTLDYSPLGPESVTYQVFYNGVLQREFTRGTPLVVVDWGYAIYPTVNPVSRRSDGALGTSLTMSTPVRFVFPEILSSGYGDQLFIRLNNPTNLPGIVSRVDVFGGGNLYDFSFNEIALGVFGREHQSLYGATLQAAPNRLRIDNFVNTNTPPGMFIKLDRVGALDLQFEPFQLARSNSFLLLTAIGSSGGDPGSALGTLRLDRQEARLSVGYEQPWAGDIQLVVLTNGAASYATNIPASDVIGVDTSAMIRAITAQAKSVQNLPGYHVRFAQSTAITIASNGPPIMGDELRLLAGYPSRMEHLNTLHLGGRDIGPIVITNEVAVAPPEEPVRLGIVRQAGNVVLTWPDPNRLFVLASANYLGPDGPYYLVPDAVEYSDPYASVIVPIVRTNDFTYFRIFYSPEQSE